MKHPGLSYRDAGVDMDAGDAFVDAIGPIARSTEREGCLGGLGGFGAFFEIPKRYRDPLLVSGTDGVGTKLKLAFTLDRHDSIGIDLVAMCVNDVLVHGAEPLFFLDYFATGKLAPAQAVAVVRGIGEGCRQAGCALIGGETAEMPGMYAKGEYDLAGFCVGVVERERVIDGRRARPGDVVLGLPASGPHSNGYSLIRKVVEHTKSDLAASLDGVTLGELLLEPTRIYVKPMLALHRALDIHAAAHITGGGLPGNLPRLLPAGTRAVLSERNWQWPAIFRWLMDKGGVAKDEMYRTFNCGIGMAVVVSARDVQATQELLAREGQPSMAIGRIEESAGEPDVVFEP
jgi:phosphoribosylformylglycinamidine cyclo-ligase